MRILILVLDKESHINFFPLGAAYLVAAIRAHGYKDITVFNQEVYHYSNKEAIKFIEEGNFDVLGVGFYGYQQFRQADKFFALAKSLCKRPITIIGGHGPSAAPEYFMDKFGVDIVVMGEGERVLCNLLDALSAKKDLSKIAGIAYRQDGKISINESQRLVTDIDSIPFPAWDMFPMEHYVLEKHIAAEHTDRCFPVLASRGCIYHCNFCYRMYKGYRLRSIENVIEEIRRLKIDYGVNHITFADENLMSTEKYAIRFAEGMIKANLDVKWNCMGRLKVALPHVLKAMKEAGCRYINYGIESLDQNVLDLMNKEQKVEEAYNGVENTIKAGLYPGLNIIWGNLGDSAGSLQKGVEFLKKYNAVIQLRTIKPVTPYPGTRLFEIAVERGLLKNVDDFYKKYLNSDRMTVNFTDIADNEFYQLLFEANKEVISDYYTKVANRNIEGFRKCYFDYDVSFRGPRHR